jgi:FdhD protein
MEIEESAGEIEKVSIVKLTEEGKSEQEDIVVKEYPLTIILDNNELVTLLCTPDKMKYLAVGYLFSEGLIQSKDEITNVLVDEVRGVVRVTTGEDKSPAIEALSKRVITSGCGRGAAFYSAADAMTDVKIDTQIEIRSEEVYFLMNEFQHRSKVFRATGGVHSAALCSNKEILIFSEDIGRHNAIDKIFGECLLEDIPLEGKIITTSGRISSEILFKVAKRSIPVLISKSAPTDMGVKLANQLGITLIGFVRGKRMSVYANEWRVVW